MSVSHYQKGYSDGYAKALDDFAEKLKWEYENSIGVKKQEIDFAVAVIDVTAERLKGGVEYNNCSTNTSTDCSTDVLRLPCKVGDIVYQVDRMHQKIITQKILKIDLEIMGSEGYTMQIWFETAGSTFSCQFGKTVFFDKNEAIQALEKHLGRGTHG